MNNRIRVIPKYLLAILVLWPLASAHAQDQGIDINIDFDLVAAPSNAGLEFLNEGSGPATIAQLKRMQDVFADVAESVSAATVNIQVGAAQGSGVVVSRDGFILTAAHVINRPNLEAKITFPDGSTANAMTLGINRGFDSGMLKITEDGKWPFLEIGESEPLEKGQWVMAIGHPGGLTEGRGLVYRAGRVVNLTDNFVTTDCTLVGGDSGGPLVDLNGYVIGIHSRIGGRLLENFHVPIDSFLDEWDQLANRVIVDSNVAYLGVSWDRDQPNIVKIRSVSKNEAAEKAGIKVGDIIVKVGEDEIETPSDFRRALRRLKPAEKVKIVVKRDDEEIELDVTMGYR